MQAVVCIDRQGVCVGGAATATAAIAVGASEVLHTAAAFGSLSWFCANWGGGKDARDTPLLPLLLHPCIYTVATTLQHPFFTQTDTQTCTHLIFLGLALCFLLALAHSRTVLALLGGLALVPP